MIRSLASALAIACVAAFSAAQPPSRTSVLEQVAEVPLPGPAVRFDYQSLDSTADRLYLSHMNAGELVVFDVARRQVVGMVSDLPRITGVCAVPSLGKVYASVTGAHHVAVIDARALCVLARVGRIGFPDGIAYVPGAGKLYVSDESGGGELVIDGRSDRVVGRVSLGGEAGNTLYDPRSRRVLVAVQTRNEVVEIDPRTDRVLARHLLAGAAHPHGMLLDPAAELLFVTNEESATLLVIDLKSWKALETHHVGNDPDVLAFDPGLRRLYVASESGTVSVFSEREGALRHDGDISMPHAHTVAIDPRTHLVYFPLQSVDGHPVLRIMRPG